MRRRLPLVVAALVLAGCYTLQPAARAPLPGIVVALDVNDVGRLALGGSIGPAIRQLEGRVVSSEDTALLLSVSSVRFLRGGEQTWTGERVRVQRGFFDTTYERRYNRGRTIALGATIGVGIAALVLAGDLLGFSTSDRPPFPPDTGVSLRVPRP